MVPREHVLHLGRQRLLVRLGLGRRARAGGVGGLLLLVRAAVFLDGGGALGAALEERDGRLRGRAGVDLREGEVAEDEEDSERDDDAKVAPEVGVRVAEREREVPAAVDGRLAGHRAHRCADLVRERDVLVARALRDQRGALAVECVELVGEQRLEAVPDRLRATVSRDTFKTLGDLR